MSGSTSTIAIQVREMAKQMNEMPLPKEVGHYAAVGSKKRIAFARRWGAPHTRPRSAGPASAVTCTSLAALDRFRAGRLSPPRNASARPSSARPSLLSPAPPSLRIDITTPQGDILFVGGVGPVVSKLKSPSSTTTSTTHSSSSPASPLSPVTAQPASQQPSRTVTVTAAPDAIGANNRVEAPIQPTSINEKRPCWKKYLCCCFF